MSRANDLYRQANQCSDLEAAKRLFEETVGLARTEGDRQTLGLALLALGMHALAMAEPGAGELLAAARAELEAVGPPVQLGVCLFFSFQAADPGDPADLERAHELLERDGTEPLTAGDCCSALARVRSDDALYERAIRHYHRTDSLLRLPTVYHSRAKLAIRRQRPEAALEFLQKGLELARSVRRNRAARRVEAEILETLGDFQLSLRRPDDGVRNLREAMKLQQQLDQDRAARRLADRLAALPPEAP